MKTPLTSFTEHPASVGETYFEHMKASLSFALPMLLGSAAALVHSFLPFLFTRTGSGIITRLYDRMVVNRSRASATKQVLPTGQRKM